MNIQLSLQEMTARLPTPIKIEELMIPDTFSSMEYEAIQLSDELMSSNVVKNAEIVWKIFIGKNYFLIHLIN